MNSRAPAWAQWALRTVLGMKICRDNVLKAFQVSKLTGRSEKEFAKC